MESRGGESFCTLPCSAYHLLDSISSISCNVFLSSRSAAVFFWPLLAAIMNHRIAGSLHIVFIAMCALTPIHPAIIVNSGKKMNSIGHPMASDKATQTQSKD